LHSAEASECEKGHTAFNIIGLRQRVKRESKSNSFSGYKKEMLYLRNFSEITLKGYQEDFDRWRKYVGRRHRKKTLSI